MSKVFISYEFSDPQSKAAVLNWRNQNLGSDIQFLYLETEPGNPRYTENQLKERILNKIKEADVIMVLVGDNTHSRNWILYEIEAAISLSKKMFWCHATGTHGGKPANLWNAKEIPLSKETVRDEIRRLQSEIDKERLGKDKK
jgi:MTH538 TIR-like domain (DUF1863)